MEKRILIYRILQFADVALSGLVIGLCLFIILGAWRFVEAAVAVFEETGRVTWWVPVWLGLTIGFAVYEIARSLWKAAR